MIADDASHLLALATELERLLEAEFDSLRVQDLTTFDQLQEPKKNILIDLSSSDALKLLAAENEENNQQSELIKLTRAKLVICQQRHQRNELVISKQLDVIKSALETIQSQQIGSSLELYTKRGRKKTSRNSVLSGDA